MANKTTIVGRSGQATRIVNCSCDHPYQDKKHGKGRRVANYAPKKKAYLCTVCGKAHPE